MNISNLWLAGKCSSLTSYFSVAFLVAFLPLCIIVYTIMPKKAKKYTLLAFSYLFFYLISGNLVAYLFITTLSVHYFGIWLDRVRMQKESELKTTEKDNKKAVKKKYLVRSRRILLFAAIMHIGMLLVLKYSPFFTMNVNSLLKCMGLGIRLDVPKYLLPIGISFFTMQAVSYIYDVYRGVIQADDNVFRLALFMSFFPEIVEGPICRYSETAEQLWNIKGIEYNNLTLGLQRILFGLMKKLVIADRLNVLIQTIFNCYNDYQGGLIAIAAICYTIQLYMDFSGTMDAVIGTAQIFGVELPENFKRPFFSKTISEFWTRWHITLGTWFKDYIFYPVSMSKPMKNLTSKMRKKIGNHFGPLVAGTIALFCVWFCNGLWHGAAWNYIFFGMYHLFFIVLGNVIAPGVKWLHNKLHINPEKFPYRLFQMVRTTFLVIIGELFFRAHGLRPAMIMFKKIITDFRFNQWHKVMRSQLGLDYYDIVIVAVTLIIILIISIMNEKGIIVREAISRKNIVIRWALFYLLIMYIVIFGAYGIGYIPVDPIYANF